MWSIRFIFTLTRQKAIRNRKLIIKSCVLKLYYTVVPVLSKYTSLPLSITEIKLSELYVRRQFSPKLWSCEANFKNLAHQILIFLCTIIIMVICRIQQQIAD